MAEEIEAIIGAVGGGRDLATPPLDLWDPPLSGDIDIRIAADGRWYHEGRPFEREAIVRLFSQILRRERDGAYYLVTPQEKWRIQVELHPLLVVDLQPADESCSLPVTLILNTGRAVQLNDLAELDTEPRASGAAVVQLEHGLTALFSRAAWYRLVELAGRNPELLARLDQGAS